MTSCAIEDRAISMGVAPTVPRFMGSAPASSKAFAPMPRLFDAIRCKGVIPYVSSASTSPPSWINRAVES